MGKCLYIKGKESNLGPTILLSKIKWQNRYIDCIAINGDIVEEMDNPKYLHFEENGNGQVEMIGTDIKSKYSFTVSYQPGIETTRGTIKGLNIFERLGINIINKQYCKYEIISGQRRVRIVANAIKGDIEP